MAREDAKFIDSYHPTGKCRIFSFRCVNLLGVNFSSFLGKMPELLGKSQKINRLVEASSTSAESWRLAIETKTRVDGSFGFQ